MVYLHKRWKLIFALVFALNGVVSYADELPDVMKLIVPYSAGGSTDATGRLLAKKMQEITGKSVIVENVTGGGSVVGMKKVTGGSTNGDSILLTGTGSITVMKHTNRELPLDPEVDLSPVTFINTLPHWIVISSNRPEATYEDFIAYIRNNPGKASISVNSVGGAAHLALANWAKENDLDFVIVPYRGSSAAMVDLLGGVTTAHVDVVGSSAPFVKSKAARALLLLQDTPIQSYPDIPISDGKDKTGLFVYGHHVLAVKEGTSKSKINKIYEIVDKVTADPDFISFLNDLGYERVSTTPSETKAILQKESKIYEGFVTSTGIKVN